MKIPDGPTIRAWDEYTIAHEPLSSASLMERAAAVFADWFIQKYPNRTQPIHIFCGNGNNGGDGLVIGRLLMWALYDVTLYKVQLADTDSPDFALQWAKNIEMGNMRTVNLSDDYSALPKNGLIIDGLLGTGLSRPVSGHLKRLILDINALGLPIVSIDIPSGVPADNITEGIAIKSTDILTFQVPKYSFFLKENNEYVAPWTIGDIGLDKGYPELIKCKKTYLTLDFVQTLYHKRSRFSHKGDAGTAYLLVGQTSMLGAAILSCKAAIKSGAGLVHGIVPENRGYCLMAAVPEVMTLSQNDLPPLEEFKPKSSLGMGPGLGTEAKSQKWVDYVLTHSKNSIVIDADALNLIAQNKGWIERIPKKSILTPHLKEFERLFGKTQNSLETFQLATESAQKHDIIILLKGAYSHIFLPDGRIYINSTGNPGMATAGSGDVLTGIITGLLAQNYRPENAALLGTYIHGLAGDKALTDQSIESLTATDIISHLGSAWKALAHSIQ